MSLEVNKIEIEAKRSMIETMDTNPALDEAEKLSKEMDQFYRKLQSLIVKKSSSLDLKR